mgnify:FL=1
MTDTDEDMVLCGRGLDNGMARNMSAVRCCSAWMWTCVRGSASP